MSRWAGRVWAGVVCGLLWLGVAGRVLGEPVNVGLETWGAVDPHLHAAVEEAVGMQELRDASRLLRWTATVQASLGRAEMARETLDRLERLTVEADEALGIVEQAAVGRSRVDVGDSDGARRTLEATVRRLRHAQGLEPHEHDQGWAGIAETQAALGDTEGALRSLGQVGQPRLGGWVRTKIAHHLVAEGRTREALEVVAHPSAEEGARDRVLVAVAVAHARAGDTDAAVASLGKVEDAAIKTFGYADLVGIVLGRGEPDTARWLSDLAWQAAEEVAAEPGLSQRDGAYHALARIAVDLDDPAGVRRAAGRIESLYSRDMALWRLFERYVETGDLDEAAAMVDEMRGWQRHTDAWATIALTMLDAEEREAAEALIERAWRTIRQHGGTATSSRALLKAHVRLGDLETAGHLFDRVGRTHSQGWGLEMAHVIASGYIEAEDFEAAESWVTGLEENRLRVYARLGVAGALLERESGRRWW
jgi:tetratricopeptide (TPR) repeat protein